MGRTFGLNQQIILDECVAKYVDGLRLARRLTSFADILPSQNKASASAKKPKAKAENFRRLLTLRTPSPTRFDGPEGVTIPILAPPKKRSQVERQKYS